MTSGLFRYEKLPGRGLENERVRGRDEGGFDGPLGPDSAEPFCFENFLSWFLVKNRGPELHGASGLSGGSHWQGARFWSVGVCPSNGSSEGISDGAAGVDGSSSESTFAGVLSRRSRWRCSSSESVPIGLDCSLAWADVPSPGSNARGSGFVTLGPPCWRVTR